MVTVKTKFDLRNHTKKYIYTNLINGAHIIHANEWFSTMLAYYDIDVIKNKGVDTNIYIHKINRW